MPGICLDLGLAYFKLGVFRNARDAFAEQDRTAPDSRVTTLLALSDFGLGEYRSADPNAAPFHMLLGEALDADLRTDEAITEFEGAAKSAPSQPEVHFGLGYLYWKWQRYDDAARELREGAHQRDTRQPS